ncbi:HD domain-containing protein [Mangrovicella endophytica]|uniref:HD domain-containing protein n=1 Tax=Mangrovicella endophytica TaxID=2066697 RepID=UPI0012FFE2B5|nr:hypothetical protein [Mangrovicella endophytica]
MHINDIRQRFQVLWHGVADGADAEAVWQALDAGYGSAGRHYHDWRHVAALLSGHAAVRTHPDFARLPADAIDLAIVFHDAVYDPARSDNEALSAAMLSDCAGASRDCDTVRAASAMILATATHAASGDPSTQLLLDLDLAILGAPRGDYIAYAAAIRQEYAAVPEDAWRIGRSAVLERFLARPRLYQTRHFGALLEAAARANLAAELSQLRAG